MKYKIFATFILFLANLGFTQSKKEQIQLLNARLDSLKSIQAFDKQTYNEKINQLELSINLKNKKVSELSISLAKDKTKLTSNIEKNERLTEEISILSDQFKSNKDSIIKIINELPFRLLDNQIIDVSNEELIKLFFKISITSE